MIEETSAETISSGEIADASAEGTSVFKSEDDFLDAKQFPFLPLLLLALVFAGNSFIFSTWFVFLYRCNTGLLWYT